MKRSAIGPIVMALAIAMASGVMYAQAPDSKAFVNDLTIAGLAEVQLGKLAAERGSNPDVKTFGQMMVKDHTKAAKFYGETLGLPFVKTWGKMPASEYQAGNLTLAVMQSDAFGLEFAPSSAMVALAVDDVEATRTRLEEHGIEFRGGILDSGVCHQSFFADPDGNLLALHHRYAPKDASPAG